MDNFLFKNINPSSCDITIKASSYNVDSKFSKRFPCANTKSNRGGGGGGVVHKYLHTLDY